MVSDLADHLFRAFEKIPDQRIERIPPPADRDVDGIVGVEERPEHRIAMPSPARTRLSAECTVSTRFATVILT